MIRNLLIVSAFALTAASVQARPLLTCVELGADHRILAIESTPTGVEAHLGGRVISGSSSQGTYRFGVGTWQ